MPPTVPDDARLAALIGRCEKRMVGDQAVIAECDAELAKDDIDDELRETIEWNRAMHAESLADDQDSAAAYRAVIAARALCADIDGPDKGPWYGNEVAIWFRAILGAPAPAPDARGGNDGSAD